MHKLKRLFKRKRPSPTKNEDITAKRARNEHLNITIIEGTWEIRTLFEMSRFLERIVIEHIEPVLSLKS